MLKMKNIVATLVSFLLIFQPIIPINSASATALMDGNGSSEKAVTMNLSMIMNEYERLSQTLRQREKEIEELFFYKEKADFLEKELTREQRTADETKAELKYKNKLIEGLTDEIENREEDLSKLKYKLSKSAQEVSLTKDEKNLLRKFNDQINAKDAEILSLKEKQAAHEEKINYLKTNLSTAERSLRSAGTSDLRKKTISLEKTVAILEIKLEDAEFDKSVLSDKLAISSKKINKLEKELQNSKKRLYSLEEIQGVKNEASTDLKERLAELKEEKELLNNKLETSLDIQLKLGRKIKDLSKKLTLQEDGIKEVSLSKTKLTDTIAELENDRKNILSGKYELEKKLKEIQAKDRDPKKELVSMKTIVTDAMLVLGEKETVIENLESDISSAKIKLKAVKFEKESAVKDLKMLTVEKVSLEKELKGLKESTIDLKTFIANEKKMLSLERSLQERETAIFNMAADIKQSESNVTQIQKQYDKSLINLKLQKRASSEKSLNAGKALEDLKKVLTSTMNKYASSVSKSTKLNNEARQNSAFLKDLEQESKSLLSDLDKSRSELVSSKKSVASLMLALDKKEKEKQVYFKTQEKIKNELSNTRNEKEKVQKTLSDLEKLMVSTKTETSKKDSKILKMSNELNLKDSSIDRLTSEKRSIEDELRETKKLKDKLESEIHLVNEKMAELKESVPTAITRAISPFESDIYKIEEDKAKLVSENMDLEEYAEDAKRNLQESERSKKDIKRLLTSSIQTMAGKVGKIEGLSGELILKTSRIKELEDSESDLKNKLKDLAKQGERSTTEVISLKAKIIDIEKNITEKIRNTKLILNKKISDAGTKFKRLQDNSVKLDKKLLISEKSEAVLRKKVTELNNKLNAIEKQMTTVVIKEKELSLQSGIKGDEIKDLRHERASLTSKIKKIINENELSVKNIGQLESELKKMEAEFAERLRTNKIKYDEKIAVLETEKRLLLKGKLDLEKDSIIERKKVQQSGRSLVELKEVLVRSIGTISNKTKEIEVLSAKIKQNEKQISELHSEEKIASGISSSLARDKDHLEKKIRLLTAELSKIKASTAKVFEEKELKMKSSLEIKSKKILGNNKVINDLSLKQSQAGKVIDGLEANLKILRSDLENKLKEVSLLESDKETLLEEKHDLETVLQNDRERTQANDAALAEMKALLYRTVNKMSVKTSLIEGLEEEVSNGEKVIKGLMTEKAEINDLLLSAAKDKEISEKKVQLLTEKIDNMKLAGKKGVMSGNLKLEKRILRLDNAADLKDKTIKELTVGIAVLEDALKNKTFSVSKIEKEVSLLQRSKEMNGKSIEKLREQLTGISELNKRISADNKKLMADIRSLNKKSSDLSKNVDVLQSEKSAIEMTNNQLIKVHAVNIADLENKIKDLNGTVEAMKKEKNIIEKREGSSKGETDILLDDISKLKNKNSDLVIEQKKLSDTHIKKITDHQNRYKMLDNKLIALTKEKKIIEKRAGSSKDETDTLLNDISKLKNKNLSLGIQQKKLSDAHGKKTLELQNRYNVLNQKLITLTKEKNIIKKRDNAAKSETDTLLKDISKLNNENSSLKLKQKNLIDGHMKDSISLKNNYIALNEENLKLEKEIIANRKKVLDFKNKTIAVNNDMAELKDKLADIKMLNSGLAETSKKDIDAQVNKYKALNIKYLKLEKISKINQKRLDEAEKTSGILKTLREKNKSLGYEITALNRSEIALERKLKGSNELSGKDIAELKDKLAASEMLNSSLAETSKKDIDSQENKYKALNMKYLKLKKISKIDHKRSDEAEKTSGILKTLREKNKGLENEITALNRAEIALERKLKGSNELSGKVLSLKTELKTSSVLVDQLTSEKNISEKEMTALKKELDLSSGLQEKIKVLYAEKNELFKEKALLEKKQTKFMDSKNEAEQLKLVITELEGENKILRLKKVQAEKEYNDSMQKKDREQLLLGKFTKELSEVRSSLQDKKEKINALEDELKAKSSRMEGMSSETDKMEGKFKNISAENAKAKNKLSLQVKKYNELYNEVKLLKANIGTISKKNAKLTTDIEEATNNNAALSNNFKGMESSNRKALADKSKEIDDLLALLKIKENEIDRFETDRDSFKSELIAGSSGKIQLTKQVLRLETEAKNLQISTAKEIAAIKEKYTIRINMLETGKAMLESKNKTLYKELDSSRKSASLYAKDLKESKALLTDYERSIKEKIGKIGQLDKEVNEKDVSIAKLMRTNEDLEKVESDTRYKLNSVNNDAVINSDKLDLLNLDRKKLAGELKKMKNEVSSLENIADQKTRSMDEMKGLLSESMSSMGDKIATIKMMTAEIKTKNFEIHRLENELGAIKKKLMIITK